MTQLNYDETVNHSGANKMDKFWEFWAVWFCPILLTIDAFECFLHFRTDEMICLAAISLTISIIDFAMAESKSIKTFLFICFNIK